MSRKIVSGMVLTLLLIGMLTLASNVQPSMAEWTGTIYIRAIYIRTDGHIDPPTAPMTTLDYVTYTFIGDIYDYSIIVERDNIILDGAGFTLEGTGVPPFSIGIILFDRINVTIKNVTVKDFYVGILLENSSKNSVSRNNIANNAYGIYLLRSSKNGVSGNNITNNECLGIWLKLSSNNRFWYNNIIDNAQQVYIYPAGYCNIWDYGYPSGGNYWSDYTGVDYYSGPYQNETGSDGIGDTPYVIDAYNVDHYPLMKPWSPAPPAITAKVNIEPKTLNLRSRGRWITGYIELPEGYNVTDINVSSIMLNNTIPAKPKPKAVEDYDNDSIPDLMVKFDRAEVISYILTNVNIEELIEERFMTITLTITGYLNDGTPFQGSTKTKIIMPMPRCWKFIRTLEIYPI